MSEKLHDLKTILRFLFRNPGNTILSIAILTLGLTLAMYMFGAIDGYVLRPLPFPASEELVHLEMANPEQGEQSLEVPPHDFLDWRRAQRSLNDFAAFHQGTINLSGDARPERFDGAFLTANSFDALRVKPLFGRTFLPGEDQPGAQPVVILGYNLWRNRYGADQSIVGKVIRVNARNAVVIGVMPPDFSFPVQEEVWIPLVLDTAKTQRGEGNTLEILGRLKNGVTLQAAQAEFEAISKRLATEFPETNRGLVAVVQPFAREFVNDETRAMLYTMFGSVLLVLLIGCANVANLTLVRSIKRTREFAIRSALGEGRGGLIFQILSECVLVSIVAGFFAYLIATKAGNWTVEMLKANPDMAPPYWVDFGTDWRTVIFAVAVALVSGIAGGIFPALRASRGNLVASLYQGGYSVLSPLGRTSRILITGQMVLSCILLISAGLMTRSVMKLDEIKIGAQTHNTLTGRIGLFESQYPDHAARVRFYEALTERLSALPGVQAAALSTSLPATFVGRNYFTPDHLAGTSQTRLPAASEVTISSGYFSAFQIPVLQGRPFDSRDRKDTQGVVIINRMLAEQFWKGQNAVGRRLQLGDPEAKAPWLTVVGVVPDVQQDETDDELGPTVYLPVAQNDTRFISLALRTSGDPMQYADSMRKAVQSLDPDLPVYWVRTLDDWIQIGRFGTSFLASLFGIFAVIGMILAAVGQYAVLAYTVGQRTREIGLRRALGAVDRAVLGLFVNQGLKQLLIALVIGLPFAFGFANLISNQLVGVKVFDPVTFVVVPLSLLIVSIFAAMIPASKALRLDPSIALHTE